MHIRSLFLCSGILFLGAFLASCEPENLAPEARFHVSPDQGDTLTVFYFDARETSDEESPVFGIQLRWDFNGDSIFDTDYLTSKEYVRRFSEPGWHHIILEATDVDGMISYASDSILVFQGNGFVDSLTDPRDGEVYAIARIKYQWVMTENLRYGSRLDLSELPGNNGITEYYTYQNNPELRKYGGLYNWDEAMNYTKNRQAPGICPPGWHLPSVQEWSDVLSIFPSQDVDQFYYWGKNSPTGFNLEMDGFLYYTLPPDTLCSWYPQNTVAWWTSDSPAKYLEDPDLFIYSIRFFPSSWEFRRHIYSFYDYWDERSLLKFACYVRCFKDPD